MDTDPNRLLRWTSTVVPVRASEATEEGGGPPGVCAVCRRTVTDECTK
jgi:hypothetical protein